MNETGVDQDAPQTDEGLAGDHRPELARLREELRQEHERFLRARADLENYRRRVERDRERMARAEQRELMLALLEIIDDFERALAHLPPEAHGIAGGLRAIHRRLLGLLERHGITPFESVGAPFDPVYHEAAGSDESREYAPGVVTAELHRGYRWGDELLRPARVRVAV
jgi:molecular chaperone GrpE